LNNSVVVYAFEYVIQKSNSIYDEHSATLYNI